MTIDFEGRAIAIIGCIPVDACPEHPTDQTDCVIEKCPCCEQEMWVSRAKRHLRDNYNNPLFCLTCIFRESAEQGREDDLHVVDINKDIQ